MGGASPAWSTPAYGAARRGNPAGDDFASRHYNYEDESQEAPRAGGASRYGAGYSSSSRSSSPKGASAERGPDSLDNIARFFGGKPGSFTRPAADISVARGAKSLRQGQRVRHAKYGEGTVLTREGEGDEAKVTVMFQRHGMKKLMEKFANLETL